MEDVVELNRLAIDREALFRGDFFLRRHSHVRFLPAHVTADRSSVPARLGKGADELSPLFFNSIFFVVVVVTNRKSKLKRSERVSSKGEENRRSQEAELELKMKMRRFGGLGFLLLLPLWF